MRTWSLRQGSGQGFVDRLLFLQFKLSVLKASRGVASSSNQCCAATSPYHNASNWPLMSQGFLNAPNSQLEEPKCSSRNLPKPPHILFFMIAVGVNQMLVLSPSCCGRLVPLQFHPILLPCCLITSCCLCTFPSIGSAPISVRSFVFSVFRTSFVALPVNDFARCHSLWPSSMPVCSGSAGRDQQSEYCGQTQSQILYSSEIFEARVHEAFARENSNDSCACYGKSRRVACRLLYT